MAITIEIDHAKTRAKAAAAAVLPVVPQAVKGPIRRIKWGILLLTLSIYYVTPFIRWDRGPNAPDQAVLLDFANGRLYAFFVEIWPQDLYLVTGLLVLASTILILTNALAGRLWCGFACPQTVWTDLFLLVERLIEGDRRQRLKNIGAPLTAKRTAQIIAKHVTWLLISLGTGGTLIFYFTDAPDLLGGLVAGDVSANVLTWVAVFTGTTYGLAGFAREQVCTFMCPWPRLQGAIWDPEAYTVNYRDYRGEQRTSAKKAAELRLQGKSAGDCVDCGQCVAVCPIGIDIREGPNFACINCGLCVDACDGVMAKLGRPRGLIDYESWANIERGHRREAPRNRLLRPKTIGLGAACVGLAGTIGVAFVTKTSATLSVQHDRDPVAVHLSDGSLRNAYTVKLLNKSSSPRRYTLSVGGIDARLSIVGNEDLSPIEVAPDASESLRVTLTAADAGHRDIVFTARDETGSAISATDRFVER
ncbi:cytochrome c oxidase accessory protein CcoG [Bradyrhizobium betae]|uniref:Cytochrome c oxidase accessory protein CcoG n=1 Tax=Bradyrhizobium betae TaxID=244734 RepID=A0A5P6PEI9_9BRAD|nr:cytochrome c oxidase accessory protein CcoG [Bradyrhizobium betae]MCS3726161.1 cytochrome c oxidase accessory protein FixG [Bradyrhizobium betae]QFI76762.1 cytochrome c oxidase accessory protein CcoG [Bradyrhizobium betae]